MQAWQLTAHGSPEKVLRPCERPDPAPKPGQVLIRSEGFGLNFADVLAVKGLYRDAPPPPCVLGYEVVGRVEKCGEGVPAEMMAKRVLAFTRFGGYAQLACTDHRAVAVIPNDMDLGTALAMATQGATAWYMAIMAAPVQKGDRVLVHSAAGGVGQLLVQIALHQGCEVFAVAHGAEKMDYLKRLGAQHVIDRKAEDYAAAVNKLMGKERLDASFNAVGGTTFKKDLALLGSGGKLVLFGGAERGKGGAFGTLRFVWNMGLVVPIFLMMKSKSLIGVNMLRLSESKPLLVAACMQGALGAWKKGWLDPNVHPVFSADQLPRAVALLGSGNSIGKVAVRWD
ncbi:MAG: zinc-binding dehydrogenase [Flavobacteriales bacterium]|nr:zinc-binding dehydrogenase [Flavobacteriales bacterium]MBP9078899.1 zinc-binding dehydrogenase [Flavobacteriales bacterium]